MSSPSAYQRLVQRVAARLPDKAREVFLHPAGPTTIFFWAPTFKWGLVIAGIGDINRPVENISLSQTFSLMMTGLIWSREITIAESARGVTNVYVALTNVYNFTRGYMYQVQQQQQQGDPKKRDKKK
ncbi:unnamed protein product [Trichogramma brassicae]|uniref:Mitochondrial pyruvate carrier n=1 Tax=Trichogramma brassicae TaxID=86971 RepID=A0A6H5J3Q0_9HYME|nr:unnamed protein product [Trichogramma brassicae]